MANLPFPPDIPTLPDLFDSDGNYQPYVYTPEAIDDWQRSAARTYDAARWYNRYKSGDDIWYHLRYSPVVPVLYVTYDGVTDPTGYFMGGGNMDQELGRISGALDWIATQRSQGRTDLPDDCNTLWLPPNFFMARHHFVQGGQVEYTYYRDGQYYVTTYLDGYIATRRIEQPLPQIIPNYFKDAAGN